MTLNNKMYYSRIIYLTAVIVIIHAFGSCKTSKIIDITNDDVFKEVKATFAPDLRVSIFDVRGIKHGKDLLLKGETNIPNAKAQLIEKFSAQKLNIADSISILPTVETKKKFAVVRLSVCNIRTKPEHSAEMATQAILGTPLNVFKVDNGWCLIQTPDNYIGWVDNSGIELLNEAEHFKWQQMQKVIAVGQQGFITEYAEEGSQPVSDFVIGSILGLKGESLNKNFWIVVFPDGRIGYADKRSFRKLEDFIETSRFVSNDDIVNSSYRFIGAPYLWGGTSSKGMDCSGFTKTVYFINGLIIPRDASQQVLEGDVVSIDESYSKLLPGDLLFFGNKRNDNSERITHVAIYIGEGRFIHSSGNVKIESLLKSDPDYNDFRSTSLLQVRRFLNAVNSHGIKKLSDSMIYLK
jgi:gamma-D-glutamyl-L-lysine dipeptidyl-peptidase